MTSRRKLHTAASTALIGLLLSSPLSAGEFYKWTDEKGTVHYSEREPENTNTSSETIHTYNSTSTGSRSSSTGTATGSKGGEKQETEKKPELKLAKKDKDLCERAKKDSETLRSRPLIRQNGKVLTMDEKNEQIKKLQDVINVHC